MHYMGGKFRQSKAIVAVIREREGTGFSYWEPFCGAMWSATSVIKHLRPNKVILSDVNRPLILLWDGLVHDRIVLPVTVTDEDYARYKRNMDMDDPITAWFGFGLSFAGKWFGGLARYGGRGRQESYDFSSNVASTIRKVEILKGCNNLTIVESDYLEMVDLDPGGFVIYADPPYENRTKAHHFDEFDHPLFWDNIRKLSFKNHVYVTCFECPDDFEVLYDWGCTITNQNGTKHEIKHGNVTEKLVIYKGRNQNDQKR